MDIIVKKFEPSLNAAAVAIWNEVVEEGMAFPQTETLDHPSGLAFFSEQSFTGVAVDQESGQAVGLHHDGRAQLAHVASAGSRSVKLA